MVDTSAIYALLDKTDQMHQRSILLLRELSTQRIVPLLTNFIVAECYALISSRLTPVLARQWLKELCWPIERVTEEDESKAREILLTYTDKAFSYTDAATFAVMQRLGLSTAFTFDDHFKQFGWTIYGQED